jgi:hypothetical protein
MIASNQSTATNMNRHTLTCALPLLLASLVCKSAAATLTFDQPQLAGISGFRAFWDTPIVLAEDGLVVETKRNPGGAGLNAVWASDQRAGGQQPGAIVFDAIHRSALVRFPGSAQRIAEELRKGHVIEKVELVLPHRATELWAEGYAEPPGMSFLGDAWEKKQPRWHAVAWALRQPWGADRERGPTFNASVNGLAYWKQFGAQDEKEDRFPQQFGPAEVSAQMPEGRLDLTPMFMDAAFGATLSDRLRVLDGNGVVLRKWETYDLSYWHGGYEWGTATGGRGIIIRAPKLMVQFKAAPAAVIAGDLAVRLPSPKRGTPAAVMPTADSIRAFATKHAFQRPAWMPDWQWQRVQELKALGRVQDYPATPEAYGKWIDVMLAKPPRTWDGFQAAEMTQDYALFSDTWPAPVREHWKLYWWAWLMPDRDIKDLVQGYIGGQQNQDYIQRTGDWRGNASVYRTYCRAMGTMNFNHWAANGTLLGGHILGSEAMLNEGRNGLEQWPLRTWCWFDGSTQESIDHYYFSISLKDQKVFADFGPTLFDRMMGRNILAKSVGELAALYHPSLKRFISSSGRTGIAYLLAIQDGTKHIVHTLSRRGVLTDVGRKDIPGGLPMLGHDADPGVIAQQTLNGPWADEWVANVVDEKPLPFEITASYKQWGNFGATPLWKRAYLGKHYGLATIDVAIGNQTVPLMAQWRRDDRPADRTEQVGTLLARFGVNRSEFLDSIYHGTTQRNPNGSIGQQGGFIASLQHRNKLLAFTSPYPGLRYSGDRNFGTNITSVQTSIALLDLQPKPTWEIYLDGLRVEQWPVRAKFGQRFTIRDGTAFLGIIPLPGATDLGRDAEVVLSDEGELTEMQGGGKLKTSLVLNLYNYHSNTPLDRARADLDEAWGGFALEISDATEFADFAAFQKHITEAVVEARWAAAEKTVHAKLVSGRDTLEAGFKPGYTGDWDRQTPTDQCFVYRRVNGDWPYLAKDVERDSTLTQISRTGRVEKGGAVLSVEPGRMACIEFEPVSGAFVGHTPLPDATTWKLEMPGGILIEPDGKVGLLRVTVWPKENRLRVEHARRPGESPTDLAGTLQIRGMNRPQVELNQRPAQVGADGRLALITPD